jgi:hypothetical protein
MTTKNSIKPESAPVDATRMAYEAHTLAQMLYGQLLAGYPWMMTGTTTALPHQVPEPFMPFHTPPWRAEPLPPHTAWGQWGHVPYWGR